MANVDIAIQVLKRERKDQLDTIDARRHDIQYWYTMREKYDEELEKLIKQFNETIQYRKTATKNIALGQHLLIADYAYLEDLDKAIKALENLV